MNGALKPAIGKPVPRRVQHQHQAHKPEIPMHMVRAPQQRVHRLPATRPQAAHPSAALLTSSPPRMRSSAADTRTPPVRTGADAALALPSRIGDRLHFRSGVVTELDGTVVRAAPTGQHNFL